MLIIEKIFKNLHKSFRNHYPQYGFISVLTAVFVGFLHYELEYNSRDLIYWKDLIRFYCNVLEQSIFIILFILSKIVLIMMYSPAFNCFEKPSEVELKKRYADFLFMRLIAKIDQIEEKYFRSTKNKEMISLKSFMMAHEEMWLTIDNFRQDARKLFTPNEVEVSLPPEEVYRVMDDDEQFVKRSRFYCMGITADEDLIKYLINP